MANKLKADVIILNVTNGFKGKMAEVILRQKIKESIKIEIRMAVMGDPGSGKSTLVFIFARNVLKERIGWCIIIRGSGRWEGSLASQKTQKPK